MAEHAKRDGGAEQRAPLSPKFSALLLAKRAAPVGSVDDLAPGRDERAEPGVRLLRGP